jgi:hypothetical protein
VGHILFSELPIETDRGIIDAVSLAPMAVHPKWQRQSWISPGAARARNLPGTGQDDCRGARASSILLPVRFLGATGKESSGTIFRGGLDGARIEERRSGQCESDSAIPRSVWSSGPLRSRLTAGVHQA